MVHIINGEIVPDNDPRVLSRTQSQPGNQRNAHYGSIRTISSTTSGAPPTTVAGNEESPLMRCASAIGMQGSVIMPAIPAIGWSAKPVEKIYLLLAFLLVLFFGWRALVFILFAYFIYQQQPATTP